MTPARKLLLGLLVAATLLGQCAGPQLLAQDNPAGVAVVAQDHRP